jgi:hypothetical protein
MLPTNVTRCAGFLPQTDHERCPRRPQCGRFLSPAQTPEGVRSPFAWSACEDGDGFIHVATVRQDDGADHPADLSPERVLYASSVRTTCAAGGV